MTMDIRSKEIVAQVALKEAFNCVHNCPSPSKEGDPFRSPEDVTAEAILVTKTILKGFVEVMAYFEEIDPTPKEKAYSAPAQSAPARGKAPTQSSTDEHVCPEHGEMEFKEGVSKAGKPWKGWFCPERDCDTKPVWIR